MRALLDDLRFSLRGMARHPGFSAAVIVTLALGIGANTAIFSVADATLRRGLPYRDPDRIVHVWETRAGGDFKQMELAYPNYLDLRARQRSFSALGGYRSFGSATLRGERTSEMLSPGYVNDDFFAVLGVEAELGRVLAAADGKPEAPAVAVVSHGFWQRRLGGDPGAIGRTLTVNDQPTTIVGVLPRSFAFAGFKDPDVILPDAPTGGRLQRRSLHWMKVIGRLRPDATVASAQADVAEIARALSVDHPDSNAGAGARVLPLADEFLGRVRPILWALFAAVGLVLVVACANVANLVLARQTGRQRELAVRAALGASRARLLALLAVDSLLHAAAAGALGLLVAFWAVDALLGTIPGSIMASMPYLAGARIDATALGFSAAVAVLSGLAVGVLPALRASRPDVHDGLKEQGRGTAGRPRTRLRDSLVVAEVAVAFVLLAGAGLVTRSLLGMLSVDPGFEPRGLLTAQVLLPDGRAGTPEQALATRDEIVARIAALPGVEGVANVNVLPAGKGELTARYVVAGKPAGEGLQPEANIRTISHDYFAVMRVPLLAGRAFGKSEPDGTLIVNRALADRMFGGDAVGKRIVFTSAKDQPAREIVGVVGDEHLGPLDEQARPAIYKPYTRAAGPFFILLARGALAADALVRAVGEVDSGIVVFGVATMAETIDDQPFMFVRRFPARLAGCFAALALALATIGIFGVLAYTVRQRTHEIGIRRAVGAQGRHIAGMLLGRSALLSAAGIALGLAVALATTRLLGSLLFAVSPSDPATLGASAALLFVVAMAASWLPARWAMRVDPMEALR